MVGGSKASQKCLEMLEVAVIVCDSRGVAVWTLLQWVQQKERGKAVLAVLSKVRLVMDLAGAIPQEWIGLRRTFLEFSVKKNQIVGAGCKLRHVDSMRRLSASRLPSITAREPQRT